MRRLSRHVVVNQNRLGDLIADGVDRRERRQRVLENHRDAPAPDLGQLPIAQSDQLALAKANRSRHSRVLRQQAHDGQRRHGLARPGLADNSQHLAGAHLIRDAAHRGDVAGLAAERHREVVDVQDGRRCAVWSAGSSHRGPRAAALRIERVAQRVADQVDRQHQHDERGGRESKTATGR